MDETMEAHNTDITVDLGEAVPSVVDTSTTAPQSATTTAKKPRRTLGLAVGLGKETSVMVQSVGKTTEGGE